MNTVAARTGFVAELQWTAASLAQTPNQLLHRRGSVRECAIRHGLPDLARSGDRDDDRIFMHIHADKPCRLFHDPSPVYEAPRQPIQRDPRSLHMTRRVTPSGWQPGQSGEGGRGRWCNDHQSGSKGSALGGSRAEPWPYFPSLDPVAPAGNGHEVSMFRPYPIEPPWYAAHMPGGVDDENSSTRSLT